MAELLLKCSGCSAHLAVDSSGVGRIINCTTCGQKVLVPEAGIAFNCPKCQTELAAPSGMAGEAFDCPGCNAALTVPNVTSPPEADVLFACTGCSLHLSAQSDSVGQVIDCTDCGQKVVVPKPSITFDCPMCQAKLAAPSSLAGQTFGCPSCDTDLVVPSVNSISEKQSTLLSVKNSSSPQTENVKLRLAKRCPKCGTILAQDASICDMCGAGIVVEPAPVHLNPDGSPLKEVPFARLATRGLGRAESDLEAIRSKRPPRRHPGQLNEMPSPSENSFPPGRACPYCGKSIALASIICIHCGTNLQTGRRHGTTNLTSKPQSPVEKPPGCIVKVGGPILFLFVISIIIGIISEEMNNPGGKDESKSKSTTTATSKQQKTTPANVHVSDVFFVDVTVRAFTLRGTYYPSHSITYELLVNGEKVRTLDSNSVSQKFVHVPIPIWGARLDGRALWRNGYGAVVKVHQTVSTKAEYAFKPGSYILQTYENDEMLGQQGFE